MSCAEQPRLCKATSALKVVAICSLVGYSGDLTLLLTGPPTLQLCIGVIEMFASGYSKLG